MKTFFTTQGTKLLFVCTLIILFAGVTFASTNFLSIGNYFITFKDNADKTNVLTGIGTVNPTEKLEVAGKIKSESTIDADAGTIVTTKDYVDGKISSAVTIGVESIVDTDDQQLVLDENSLTLVDGGSVDLSKYLDDTDTKITDTEISALGYVKIAENEGLSLSVNSFSADTILKNSDYMNLCNASLSSKTLTLPDATAAKGIEINIKKADSSGNACVVNTVSNQKIDGETSFEIGIQYTSFSFISDGTQWWIK